MKSRPRGLFVTITPLRIEVRWNHLCSTALVLFLLACSEAAPGLDDRDSDEGLTTVHVTPGDTIAVFPPPGGSLFLETVRGMALAEDGRSVYLLDAHAVHHLDLDGNLLASMGGEGEGPGELVRPIVVQPAAEGGAWVYDPANGRATRYGPESVVAEEISGINARGAMFVPWRDGILLPAVPGSTFAITGADVVSGAGEATRERLLSHHFGSGDMVEVQSPPGVPDDFLQDGSMGRVAGWRMAAISPSEIAIVIGGSDLSAWRLVLGGNGAQIDTIVELPLPGDVRKMVREGAQGLGPGVFTMPVTGARVVG